MPAKVKAKKRKPVKKLKRPVRKPVKKAKRPKPKARPAAVMAAPRIGPLCPTHQILCGWNSSYQAWRCATCGKLYCPDCWSQKGTVVTLTTYTYGRYKCPQCGYTTPMP
jgi:hypothetical protein